MESWNTVNSRYLLTFYQCLKVSTLKNLPSDFSNSLSFFICVAGNWGNQAFPDMPRRLFYIWPYFQGPYLSHITRENCTALSYTSFGHLPTNTAAAYCFFVKREVTIKLIFSPVLWFGTLATYALVCCLPLFAHNIFFENKNSLLLICSYLRLRFYFGKNKQIQTWKTDTCFCQQLCFFWERKNNNKRTYFAKSSSAAKVLSSPNWLRFYLLLFAKLHLIHSVVVVVVPAVVDVVVDEKQFFTCCNTSLF